MRVRCCICTTACACFFFLSRRRHTRSLRDWSSDVCSSDLVIGREVHKNELECAQYRDEATDAVHEVFLAVEDLELMLKYTNPLMLYDLEKYHPRAFQEIKDYKYQFLYEALLENLRRGIEEGVYRVDIQKDIVAKNRIESVFLVFNPDLFPHTRYRMSEVNFELALLFLYGIATDNGKLLIEKYSKERT